MSEYETLLVEAYTGEIFGDAFFAALADAQPNPDRAAKLRALQRIEARTAAMLKPLPRDPALVAHEQTISTFTELELTGHEDLSLALLERYLESAP